MEFTCPFFKFYIKTTINKNEFFMNQFYKSGQLVNKNCKNI